MPNKLETLLTQAQPYLPPDTYAALQEECAALGDKPTPAKLRNAYPALLQRLTESMAAGDIKTCLQGCNCLGKNTIEKAKRFYTAAESLEDFLGKLNEAHIGGGELHMEDGKIIGVYRHCYCGFAKQAKNLPPVYCQCSAGWFHSLFSAVLDCPVAVVPRHTILDGAAECVFEISIDI